MPDQCTVSACYCPLLFNFAVNNNSSLSAPRSFFLSLKKPRQFRYRPLYYRPDGPTASVQGTIKFSRHKKPVDSGRISSIHNRKANISLLAVFALLICVLLVFLIPDVIKSWTFLLLSFLAAFVLYFNRSKW